MQDIFVLSAYNFGYQMIPILMKDQLSQAGQGGNPVVTNLGLNDKNKLKLSVDLAGLMGLAYGVFILRVTKLGLRMREKRSWLGLMFLIVGTVGLPNVATTILFQQCHKRNYSEYNNIDKHFDPIDSYLRHMIQ